MGIAILAVLGAEEGWWAGEGLTTGLWGNCMRLLKGGTAVLKLDRNLSLPLTPPSPSSCLASVWTSDSCEALPGNNSGLVTELETAAAAEEVQEPCNAAREAG